MDELEGWYNDGILPEGILGKVIEIPVGWTVEKTIHRKANDAVDPFHVKETIGIHIKKVD